MWLNGIHRDTLELGRVAKVDQDLALVYALVRLPQIVLAETGSEQFNFAMQWA